jgi:flagella basal body P-ring formation protein FlgA
MMRGVLISVLLLTGSWATAEVTVPVRTIRVKEIIREEDLILKSQDIKGAISQPQDIIGKEARITLYAGRPIRPRDIGSPAIIGRNDMVSLVFSTGFLNIVTEGRALGRGAVGDTIRAMNLGSRIAVTGIILADGSIEVQ